MIPDEAVEVERTVEQTFTRECTLCGGDIHITSGERQRHACRLPRPSHC